jgi:hypothetical protein
MLAQQSNISKSNIDTAAAWTTDTNAEVATLALLVVEIGRVHPRRKKRHGNIRRDHPELFRRMIAAGVVSDWSDTADEREPDVDVAPGEGDEPFTDSWIEDDAPF